MKNVWIIKNRLPGFGHIKCHWTVARGSSLLSFLIPQNFISLLCIQVEICYHNLFGGSCNQFTWTHAEKRIILHFQSKPYVAINLT